MLSGWLKKHAQPNHHHFDPIYGFGPDEDLL